MGRQIRAEVTRRRIIDAAVDLFDELGYGETGLADILVRADVTKGAFYYHFESKEAIASAIIDASFQTVVDAAATVIEPGAPALENIIRATFVVADAMDNDRTVRVGKQLAQSLNQVSERGPKAFLDWTALFVGQIAAAVSQGDLRADIDAQEVGETVWATVLGTHLLSDAVGDDVLARLARMWRVLLAGIVSDSSLPYFRDFTARIHHGYARAPLTAQ